MKLKITKYKKILKRKTIGHRKVGPKHIKVFEISARRIRTKSLETKFIGCLTKKGKRTKFKNIFSKSLLAVSKNLKLKPREALRKVFRRLKCILEIRKIRIRRNTHVVPMPVKPKRQIYLVIKKVLNALDKDKSKITLVKKLQKEIFMLLKRKDESFSLQEKKRILVEAFENKSNIHYRW